MKLRTHIAVALLVAAVAVPAAHADKWGIGPNGRGGALGPATVSVVPDAVDRYLSIHAQAPRVDTSDVVSRYLRNHAQALAGPPPSRSGAGFDWADAGIGAGGILGIMLLAGTAAFVVRQGRRRLTSA
jgi:hypothetical protein